MYIDRNAENIHELLEFSYYSATDSAIKVTLKSKSPIFDVFRHTGGYSVEVLSKETLKPFFTELASRSEYRFFDSY